MCFRAPKARIARSASIVAERTTFPASANTPSSLESSYEPRDKNMKKKVIRIVMPDQSQWDVPAELVAHDRAVYLATEETGEINGSKHTECYNGEFAYTIGNHDELIDWAANNMDWDDVKSKATMHKAGSVDYQEGWVNGPKHVVEVK